MNTGVKSSSLHYAACFGRPSIVKVRTYIETYGQTYVRTYCISYLCTCVHVCLVMGLLNSGLVMKLCVY